MKKLADLIIENPDLEIVVIADPKISEREDDWFCQGTIDNVCIDYVCDGKKGGELLTDSRRHYVYNFDEDLRLDEIEERLRIEEMEGRLRIIKETDDDDYIKEKAREYWNKLAWEKAILVYVS
jgi:hypothetical protein